MRASLLIATLLASAPAFADDAVDVSAIKDKLKVVSDGKKHYVAVVPFGENVFDHLYYGDGKTFWQQRVSGGGSSGTESFDRYFWEPRSKNQGRASFSFRDGKYTLQCEERLVELKPLSDDEARKIVAAAKFAKSRWKRQAYLLARDNRGTYYYVDRLRDEAGGKGFRLFAGQKGAMKLQKMVNIVNDSAGDIFATRSGELRLVANQTESLWVEHEKETKLIALPVSDNHVLIYSDLGVYTGELLGTPCDDL
jgi:hypothetical protein